MLLICKAYLRKEKEREREKEMGAKRAGKFSIYFSISVLSIFSLLVSVFLSGDPALW